MREYRIIVVIFICILFVSMVYPRPYYEQLDDEVSSAIIFSSLSYIEHDPIRIHNDSAFVNQGWPGAGSISNPYRIAGLNITPGLPPIEITDTSKYFVIEDCLLPSGSMLADGASIFLENVTNSIIRNCTFYNTRSAVRILESRNIMVDNCTIEDSVNGVHLENSNDSICRNIKINDAMTSSVAEFCINVTFIDYNSHTNTYGIIAENCRLVSIENNTVVLIDGGAYEKYWCIRADNCNDTKINRNNITSGWFGIYLTSHENSTIKNNTIIDAGLYISYLAGFYNHTIIGNTVNDKMLGYFYNLKDLNIDGSEYGQVVIAECENISLEGGSFDNAGLSIRKSTNCKIDDISIDESCFGVDVVDSYECNISDATISNSYLDSLRLINTNRSRLDLIDIADSLRNGIWLTNSSYNNITRSSVFNSSSNGVQLESDSYYNRIWNNSFSLNHENAVDYGLNNDWDDGVNLGNWWDDWSNSGPYPVGGSAGSLDHYPRGPLYLSGPDDISIDNESLGVTIEWSAFSAIPDKYEILLESSIVDEGSWNGTNIPYQIYGPLPVGTYNYTLRVNETSGNVKWDSVILTVAPAVHLPSITAKSDINLFAYEPFNITWEVFDSNPSKYLIFMNDTLLISGDWDGNDVSISIIGLPVGDYNYTLFVNDTTGQYATDSFLIHVTDPLPLLNSPLDLVFTVGTTGNIIEWNATDDTKDIYEIYVNGTIVYTSDWTLDIIVFNLDGFGVGVYNVTIRVVDLSGNIQVDTVIVTVVESLTSTTTTTSTASTTTDLTGTTNTTNTEYIGEIEILSLTITIASVGVIIIFLILILKKRD